MKAKKEKKSAARKKSVKPTRIWKFAAKVDDTKVVNEILFLARRHYNELVAIERDRYARFVEIRRMYAPVLAEMEERWDVLDDQIVSIYRDAKAARQKHWRSTVKDRPSGPSGEKKRLLPPDLQAKVDRLKEEQKVVSNEAKEHRASFSALLEPAREELKRRSTDYAIERTVRVAMLAEEKWATKEGKPDFEAELEERKRKHRDGSKTVTIGPLTKAKANEQALDEMLGESQWSEAWKAIALSDREAHRASKRAALEAGIPTGTKNAVTEAFMRAKKDSAPKPPRFRQFDGGGKLMVQLRNTTWKDLRVGLPTLSVTDSPRVDRHGEAWRAKLVHLDQTVPIDGKPGVKRMITFETKLHREPPADAEVKWASLFVRRVGRRYLYEFQVTLEDHSFAAPKRPAGVRAPEHIEIGWARVDQGVRVAKWPGGDVVVPETILQQHEHAAVIDGESEKRFGFAKELLRRWMRGGPHHLTAWHRILSDRSRGLFRYACIEFAKFQLPKLVMLWKAWKKHRLDIGADLYADPHQMRNWLRKHKIAGQADRVAFWAYVWARKDEHLTQFATDSERRFQNRRNTFFRSAAIRIATEFSEITVDNYNIAKLKELPPLSMPKEPPRERAQHYLHSAAPGRFREILLEVMGPRCTPCERPRDEQTPVSARTQKVVKKRRRRKVPTGEPASHAAE